MKPVKSQNYNVKLAGMQFSSTVSIDHPFTAWKNVQNFKEKIRALVYIGQGTYSYYAISNATQLFKTEGRERSIKVAFLMTDGVDHPNSPNVQGIATAARSLGIHFFTIGLSKKNVKEEKLRLISDDLSSKQVLCLDDQNLIGDVTLELVSNADVIWSHIYPWQISFVRLVLKAAQRFSVKYKTHINTTYFSCYKYIFCPCEFIYLQIYIFTTKNHQRDLREWCCWKEYFCSSCLCVKPRVRIELASSFQPLSKELCAWTMIAQQWQDRVFPSTRDVSLNIW